MFWKPAHDRMRRELDQRTEPHQPEQRLEDSTEQNDGEEHQKRGGDAGFAASCGVAMQQGVSSRPRKNVVVMRGA